MHTRQYTALSVMYSSNGNALLHYNEIFPLIRTADTSRSYIFSYLNLIIATFWPTIFRQQIDAIYYMEYIGGINLWLVPFKGCIKKFSLPFNFCRYLNLSVHVAKSVFQAQCTISFKSVYRHQCLYPRSFCAKFILI